MSIRSMLDAVNPRQTPQTAPIPGREADMAKNHAGGFSFVVDDWTRLERFLILGSDAPTYYASAKKLTRENAAVVDRCLKADGKRLVDTVVAVSTSGRAPKNDPAIFALAMAMKLGDEATRGWARAAVPSVCRIGTHLFALAEAVQTFGGWGRGTKRAFGNWYVGKTPSDLVYQAIKYQQRNGWSHRDVLRLSKPKVGFNPVLHWITKGWEDVGAETHPDPTLARIWAFERAKRSESAGETVRLILDYDLPRECVRTEHLNDAAVWEALLQKMPITAMIRNLGKMTSVGLLSPTSEAARLVTDRLGSTSLLQRGRVHPLSLLVAQKVYAQGHGEKGSLSWSPAGAVVDALDRAFYAAFAAVPSTGKRWLLALDVSGSMSSPDLAGMPGISPRVGSAAMALVTAATEPAYEVVGFSSGLTPLSISPRQRLDDVVRSISGLPFDGTDCAQPMLYALRERRQVDVFVVYTDNETWSGSIHPVQALKRYRDATGIPAKLIVVGMTATEFTIADPNDTGMLDVAGFDTAAPAVMADFASGGSAAGGIEE